MTNEFLPCWTIILVETARIEYKPRFLETGCPKGNGRPTAVFYENGLKQESHMIDVAWCRVKMPPSN